MMHSPYNEFVIEKESTMQEITKRFAALGLPIFILLLLVDKNQCIAPTYRYWMRWLEEMLLVIILISGLLESWKAPPSTVRQKAFGWGFFAVYSGVGAAYNWNNWGVLVLGLVSIFCTVKALILILRAPTITPSVTQPLL